MVTFTGTDKHAALVPVLPVDPVLPTAPVTPVLPVVEEQNFPVQGHSAVAGPSPHTLFVKAALLEQV